VLLTRYPEHGFAGADRLKFALRSTDSAGTFEYREDLRERGRVTPEPSVRR